MNERRLRTVCTAVLVTALGLWSAPASWANAPSPAPDPDLQPIDFTEEARLLYRVAACGDEGPIPDHLNKTVIALHCAELTPARNSYHRTWVTEVQAFMKELVPDDVPDVVVYPFGGGDLVSALATFADAREITTISLEPAGDPREINTISKTNLPLTLQLNRRNLVKLYDFSHSKTSRMGEAAASWLPAQLIMALAALTVHGYEPTGLRYFRLKRNGDMKWITPRDIRARAGEIKLDKLGSWDTAQAWRRLFANMELRFQPIGGGPERVFRHISADCLDDKLEDNPGVIPHLEAKGKVTMMTKAASYLLWWPTFSKMREYVLGHMAWMVSDSTGVAPHHAGPRGFEQVTYGVFEGPFFESGEAAARAFRELWKKNEKRELPFYYGYPDSSGKPHMVVTRPKTVDTDVAQEKSEGADERGSP